MYTFVKKGDKKIMAFKVLFRDA